VPDSRGLRRPSNVYVVGGHNCSRRLFFFFFFSQQGTSAAPSITANCHHPHLSFNKKVRASLLAGADLPGAPKSQNREKLRARQAHAPATQQRTGRRENLRRVAPAARSEPKPWKRLHHEHANQINPVNSARMAGAPTTRRRKTGQEEHPQKVLHGSWKRADSGKAAGPAFNSLSNSDSCLIGAPISSGCVFSTFEGHPDLAGRRRLLSGSRSGGLSWRCFCRKQLRGKTTSAPDPGSMQ